MNIKKFFILLFIGVALASCGGGGGSSSNDSGGDASGVAGKAMKGPISGGTVICYFTIEIKPKKHPKTQFYKQT